MLRPAIPAKRVWKNISEIANPQSALESFFRINPASRFSGQQRVHDIKQLTHPYPFPKSLGMGILIIPLQRMFPLLWRIDKKPVMKIRVIPCNSPNPCSVFRINPSSSGGEQRSLVTGQKGMEVWSRFPYPKAIN